MDGYCKYCGSEVDTGPDAIGRKLIAHKNLYYWEDHVVGDEVFVPNLGNVKIVHNTYHSLDDNGDLKLIWETPYGFVGVTGYYSSYNGSAWNDDFKTAEKKTKEVVYFE